MKITVNNKEVENPLARALIVATMFVFIACMIILLVSFAVVVIPLILIIAVIGVLTNGNKKRKN